VEDAGLVLLWPFLERFFARAGLLDEQRRFVDEAGSLRAIALLAQLAFEDPELPEYLLPLAKILCGRSPETSRALEAPEPELLAECERLLLAVRDHCPDLHELSLADLRRLFLRRPALLSERNGGWLLQVERQAQDELLARVPWAWGWIKLPWMTWALQVEW
jgi:hypothetical protein